MWNTLTVYPTLAWTIMMARNHADIRHEYSNLKVKKDNKYNKITRVYLVIVKIDHSPVDDYGGLTFAILLLYYSSRGIRLTKFTWSFLPHLAWCFRFSASYVKYLKCNTLLYRNLPHHGHNRSQWWEVLNKMSRQHPHVQTAYILTSSLAARGWRCVIN